MLHSFILSAQAFPIGYRTENAGAEKPVAFRLKRAVVDGFRLGNFAVRPGFDFFGRRQRYANRLEIRG